ncbi:MAG: hypothetical protein P8008_02825, partial [Gammaproteobacteria bacterium]
MQFQADLLDVPVVRP